MEKNIYHSGVKGMRWGVRRYQNADGSLTPAGKIRLKRDMSEHAKAYKKGDMEKDPNRWVKEDISRTKKLTEASSEMVGLAKNINDNNSRGRKKTRLDLTSMSDKELRDRINRESLERQYNDMFAPQKVSRGRENVSKVLSAAGTTLTLASTSLGIALAIKELKG